MEAPKKSKKKSKDYDKKGEKLAASSDFDAYIDKTVCKDVKLEQGCHGQGKLSGK